MHRATGRSGGGSAASGRPVKEPRRGEAKPVGPRSGKPEGNPTPWSASARNQWAARKSVSFLKRPKRGGFQTIPSRPVRGCGREAPFTGFGPM